MPTNSGAMSATDRLRRLSVFRKTAYGVGQLSEGVVTIVFMIYLLFYYNQVLGLSGSAAGLALFLALLFDAVSDPLMGAISDRTRSRWGRRHPFLYAAVLPLPIAFYLLFSPPASLGEAGLFLWLTFFSIASRLALTIFFVPHLALGAEMTTSYHERNHIVAYRQFFSMIGYLAAIMIGFGVFFTSSPDFPEGQLNPGAYSPFAATMAAIMSVSMLASALGTHRLVSRLPTMTTQSAANLKAFPPFWLDLQNALANHSFKVLITGLLIFYIAFGVRTSLSLHLYTHYWTLSTAEIELITIATIMALVVGVLVWAFAGKMMEKRTGFILGFLGWVALTAWPVVQNMLGLYPDRTHGAYVGLLLWTGVGASIMGAGTNIFAGSMIADCLDENELRTGDRQEGAFFGAFTITAKATTGLGTWISGVALDLIEFPKNATPGEVSAETLEKLGFLCGPLLLLGGVSALVILHRYSLSRARLEEIQTALSQQKEASS